MINFNTSMEDAVKIGAIVKRAKAMAVAQGVKIDSASLHMDRDDNSPTGGQCLNCFLPRFAVKEETEPA